MGRERRITNTVGTIPNFTALAGTVTRSTANSTILIYDGSNDIATIMPQGSIGLNNSTFWLYVIGVSPFVARVIGIYKNDDENYSISLDRAMGAVTGGACAYVRAGVQYSYLNDGGADGTVNGVTIKNGEGNNYSPYEKYSNRPLLQPVSYVVATSTDFLINEEL